MQKYKKSETQTNMMKRFYNISHQQTFQLGNIHPSTVQFDKSFLLELVQNARHVQTTVVEFFGQLLHQDIERLRTCRIDAVLGKEADKTVPQHRRTATPSLVDMLLCLGRKEIDQIQAEHQEILQQTEHLLLGDRQEVHIRDGRKVMGIRLIVAEDGLLLQDVWR